MSSFKNIFSLVLAAMAVSACTPSVDQMKRLISDHPEIITDAMEKNPGKFGEAIQKAAYEARRQAQETLKRSRLGLDSR